MRRGFTLVELVVTLAIAGVAFTAFVAVTARQERAHARLARRIHSRSQALEALATLSLDLRALSSSAGDIVVAQDSAIELRSTVASLAVCETRSDGIVTSLASPISAPKAGDTLWALAAGDSLGWVPLALTAVAPVQPGDPISCTLPPLAAGSSARGNPAHQRYLLGLGQAPPTFVGPGSPLRLTRRVRYSLYRAPDGQWYLGRREWSGVLRRFETIQPVSGPYHPYAAAEQGLSGFELRYQDRAGNDVDPAGHPVPATARIDVTIRTRPPPTEQTIIQRRDVTSIVVAPRNQT